MRYILTILLVIALFLPGCSDPESNTNLSKEGQVALEHSKSAEGSQSQITDEDFDLLEEEPSGKVAEISDPLEPVNRLVFGLNDVLYSWVLIPVSQFYTDVAPEPARIGIRNFFNNVTTPIRYANCLLQGKGEGAKAELDRFLINTTEGILGFGDPAKDKHGIEAVYEDLGQTLAVHGFGNGWYLVIPLLGPSTLRDAVGGVGDLFLNPVFYLEPCELRLGVSGGKQTNESSFHIGEYESLKADTIDHYIAIRQTYRQYRNKKIEE
jgi:phospholipid-binding lipoprotein MlaA